MKKFLRITGIALAVIGLLLSAAFLVIEGEKLLCGDFLLHENHAVGLIQILLCTLLPLGIGISSVRQIMGRNTLYECLLTDVSCAVLALLLVNGIGAVLFALAVLNHSVNLMLSKQP